MPRYRFAWSNLPHELLEALADDLGLVGNPAEALRRRYGARPKTDFIHAAWPTLMDAWLPANTASREFIVEELQFAGLGRTEISTRGPQGQLEYLRSCRNAPTLREIVLAVFLIAGETQRIPAPPVRDLPTVEESAPRRRSETPPQRGPSAPQVTPRMAADDDLNRWIETTLKEAYGVAEVHRDHDGDIPIPRGSSVLFIRPHDGESPFLEVFAPLLQDFELSPDVYEAVNAINERVPMAKASVSSSGTLIVLSTQLLTHTLSAAELLLAIDLVSGAADHFDTLLQKRFGGRTLLDDDDDAIEV